MTSIAAGLSRALMKEVAQLEAHAPFHNFHFLANGGEVNG